MGDVNEIAAETVRATDSIPVTTGAHVFDAYVITTNGTIAATLTIRRNNASGVIVWEAAVDGPGGGTALKLGPTKAGPKLSDVLWFEVSGTGSSAILRLSPG